MQIEWMPELDLSSFPRFQENKSTGSTSVDPQVEIIKGMICPRRAWSPWYRFLIENVHLTVALNGDFEYKTNLLS